MVDILYLAHQRPEFTEASFLGLCANTNWARARLVIYTDGDRFLPWGLPYPRTAIAYEGAHGGPVAIMNHFLLQSGGSEIFAKIDNDVIVPPGWLDAGLAVMEAHPELDLLGIEPPASRTPAPWSRGMPVPAPELQWPRVGYAPCTAIGGIGLMRRRAFLDRDKMKPHHLYGGFTDWQIQHPEVIKGWIVPPLKVFLLDRLPIEPWASLSREYLAKGWQRPWTNYSLKDSSLWDWWTP